MTNQQLQELRQYRQRKISILETISRHYHLAACALKKDDIPLYERERRYIVNHEHKWQDERIRELKELL